MAPYLNGQDENAQLRLSFAHQMINSTLMNAILTDPGPVHLNSDVFKQEMVTAISAYIGLTPASSAVLANERHNKMTPTAYGATLDFHRLLAARLASRRQR